MTVGELISILRALPQDRRVVVEGYELGLSDLFPFTIREVRAILGGEGESNYGGLHKWNDRSDAYQDPAAVPVILLQRLSGEDQVDVERTGELPDWLA